MREVITPICFLDIDPTVKLSVGTGNLLESGQERPKNGQNRRKTGQEVFSIKITLLQSFHRLRSFERRIQNDPVGHFHSTLTLQGAGYRLWLRFRNHFEQE